MLVLNIGSYNVAAMGENSKNLSRIAAEIRSLDLDIVGLQEVDRRVGRSGKIDQLELLAALSGLKYSAFYDAIELDGGHYGVAVISRYPIISSERVFLESGGHEQRVFSHTVIDVCSTRLDFFNTHLSFESAAVRGGQLAHAAAAVSEYGQYILTGDFNISSFSELDVFGDAVRASSPENPMASFRGDIPFLCIDNIIASSECIIENVALSSTGLSDHNLLHARVHIKEQMKGPDTK